MAANVLPMQRRSRRVRLARRVPWRDLVRRVPWRGLAVALGALAVLGPLVLSAWFDLPFVVFALPPMTLWVGVWTVFRRLDRPRAVTRPSPPGTAAAVVELPRRCGADYPATTVPPAAAGASAAAISRSRRETASRA